MKPLILVFVVALYATLLNLARAGTDAGMQVVASYNGYDMRQFPTKPTLACVKAMGWENITDAENKLQSIAEGGNDMKETVPLGTPVIMVTMIKSPYVQYCKYVTDGYARPTITVNNSKNTIWIHQGLRYAFYAKKAADKSLKAVQATAAEVLALLAAEKDPQKRIYEGIIMVEVTASNEVYVGPLSYKSVSTTN